MRCQRAQQRLMAYHDSELSAGAGRRLEKHLQSCDDCRQLLENLRVADHHASQADGINPVVGVPDMPPPEDSYWDSFTARVLDRVEEDAATRAPERRKTRKSWDLFIPRMVPAFSVALVVVVAAGVLMKIGGPGTVIKTPPPSMEVAAEKGAQIEDALPVKDEAADREGRAESVVGESGRLALERSIEPDESFRPSSSAVSSAPSPAPKPRAVLEPESSSTAKTAEAKAVEEEPEPRPAVVIAQRETKADTGDLNKKTALAEPMDAVKAEETRIAAAPVPSKETAPAAVESDAVPPPVVPESEIGIPVETAARTAADPSPETLSDHTPTTDIQTTAVQSEKVLAAAAQTEGTYEVAAKRDSEEPKAAAPEPTPEPVEAAPSADPVIPGFSEGKDLENEMKAADVKTPSLMDKEPARISRTRKPPLEEPEMLAEAGVINEELDLPGSSPSAVSGIKALDSAAPVKEVRKDFATRQPYRGPEDQLTHARRLAEVRKFWESEQVLKDLISQKPPAPIEEEASILLVKVLSSQNRVGEAQMALDDAKAQFPANDMIQTYQLGQEGERPVQ